jgi:transposase-like protein
VPQQPCLDGQRQALLALVQMRQQDLEPCSELPTDLRWYAHAAHTTPITHENQKRHVISLRLHKERNVLDHLPERERPQVKQRLRRAWAHEDHDRALDQLRQLGRELDHSYPGAAGSLREGMEETLTLTRLGVSGNLKRTLESTNPVESMIEIVRWTQRNVKRWSSGEMALRWTAAGMLEAERQFRKIIGYRDLATSSSRSSATTPATHRSHPNQGGRYRRRC